MAERVSPPQLNYDNILPLAIESRSNRREFLPVNGQTFSNSNGATIIRIDVNADSMLDASHSYLEAVITNDQAVGSDNGLALNPFTPSFIQRLRIECAGVVLEDINEYSRLYSMLALNQCPEGYLSKNFVNQGLYQKEHCANLQSTGAVIPYAQGYNGVSTAFTLGQGNARDELHYPMSAQAQLSGNSLVRADGIPADGAGNRPSTTGAALNCGKAHGADGNRIGGAQSKTLCIPLVSGWLNMDKYIPLVMMNNGFTIELTLCDANRIGITQTETGSTQGNLIDSTWTISGVKYVAHLIDLDRSFYDRLRMVMEQTSGSVLQLAGQTYRHYVGDLPSPASEYTITLPARVKSVKSIFGTFITATQMGSSACYDTSVFQSANINNFRFEIGSVRYPQTNVNCATCEFLVELQKAWGKLGDYQHQQAYEWKHTRNVETARAGTSHVSSLLSAFTIGYDFEAFARVALEAGINTSDRSLPINFVVNKGLTTGNVRADFFVLIDAIYYINLDGSASVSH